MALKLNERYPGRFDSPSAGYPQGAFKNRTTPTAKDGSYLEKDWANDKEGFFQSLLSDAGLVANGSVDSVGNSQYFDALKKVIGTLVPDASTTVKGLVELATNSETQSGLDASLAVTPAGLTSRTATETRSGIAAVATQAVVNAGVDDAAIVTPKKLRAGISMLLSSNGYIALPSWLGGLIIQWGAATVAGGSGVTAIPMSIGFPTTAFSFSPQWQQTSQQTTSVTFMGSFNAGRTAYNMWTNQAAGTYGILWLAVGV
ncbi:hypothetical protein WLF18_00995 [Pseudomonas shirazensis]|uniref:Putative tail fiber protein gp53-like C-terminal domain-containing protein n=1 Tax=Pseudomonas shirazensis TaxID=2745494 RepID=A0ABU8ZTR7_9PSED